MPRKPGDLTAAAPVRATRNMVLVALVAASMAACEAGAQVAASLNVGGTPVTIVSPGAADYDAGSVGAMAPASFQVTAMSGNGSAVATVTIRAASATLANGKPVSDVQWRRADLGTWRSLSLADALVESREIAPQSQNDSWQNTIHFRVALDWTGDPPGEYQASFVLTLTLTQP